MKNRFIIRTVGVLLTLSILFSQVAFAAPAFKDVSNSHWAYSSIVSMADAGIIVGDSTGNYYPDQMVDKFSASKMFARLAGFKYVSLTGEEQTYQDRAYEANKQTLAMLKSSYKKWDASADKEIAFLIEKEILTAEDLNQFITKLEDGSERTRALLKQEAAVFLVRLLNRKAEAQNVVISSRFNDDASINAAYKNYVYYLKQLGVISGDNNNNFNPNGGVTRASMAVLLNKCYEIQNGATGQITDTTGGGVTTFENVAGSIKTVYESARAVEVALTGKDRNSIVKVGNSAGIYVDGFVKTFADLKADMAITGVISGGEFIELRASTSGTTTVNPNTDITTPDPSYQLTVIDGTVSSVKTEGTVRTITIDLQMLNPRGGVTTDSRSYTLSNDCRILRGTESVSFDSVVVGDIVTAEVSGSTVSSIIVEEKTLSFKGKLVEKRDSGVSGLPALIVRNDAGKDYELSVTGNTAISRKNSGSGLSYQDLRKGDTVDVTAEYGVLSEVYAEGTRNTVEGYVEQIHIHDNGQSYISFRHNDNKQMGEYPVIDAFVDIYTIRAGSKLRLRLESEEIDSFTVLQEPATNTITGRIYTVRSDYMTVTDANNGPNKQIYLTEKTVVFDATTGTTRKVSVLEDNMEVYVTFETGSTLKAKSITILSH